MEPRKHTLNDNMKKQQKYNNPWDEGLKSEEQKYNNPWDEGLKSEEPFPEEPLFDIPPTPDYENLPDRRDPEVLKQKAKKENTIPNYNKTGEAFFVPTGDWIFNSSNPFVAGLTDPVVGLMQLGQHLFADEEDIKKTDELIQQREKYLKKGTIPLLERTAGNILNPSTWLGAGLTTTLPRSMAYFGGQELLFNPIKSEGNYWTNKTITTGLAGGLGSAGRIAGGVTKIKPKEFGKNLFNDIVGNFKKNPKKELLRLFMSGPAAAAHPFAPAASYILGKVYDAAKTEELPTVVNPLLKSLLNNG